MIKLKQAVIVEGKYDKIKLMSVVDAPIIVTNGFSIFSDKLKMNYIKKLAEKRGIIILTDSDNAGFMIRKRILSAVPKSCEVINVYIPDIFGKEKRKEKAGAEGKLGVEGIKVEVLKEAFKRAGVLSENVVETEKTKIITKTDFYILGLSGGSNSALKRKSLLKKLDLPENMSVNGLIEAVNILIDYDEFYNICDELFAKEIEN